MYSMALLRVVAFAFGQAGIGEEAGEVVEVVAALVLALTPVPSPLGEGDSCSKDSLPPSGGWSEWGSKSNKLYLTNSLSASCAASLLALSEVEGSIAHTAVAAARSKVSGKTASARQSFWRSAVSRS